jgi:peptide/nickel transport system permease protein
MSARRIHGWVLVWVPILWLVLTMLTYPKDISLSDGIGQVMRGFFSSQIASYPAWLIAVLGAAALLASVLAFRRHRKSARLVWSLAVLAAVFFVWCLAEMRWTHFAPGAHACTFSWLFQTLALIVGGACAWTWADTTSARAGLLVDRFHVNWTLFKGNRQGVWGLAILVFFAALALLAPFLANHTYLDAAFPVGKPMSPPSLSYYGLFGTDEQGMSVLAEWIWSARISLLVGLGAAALSAVIGAGVGIAAGFFGGWKSDVSMRATDFFLVLPWLPLAMVLAAAWGRNYGMLILIIGITTWPGTARIVRSETIRIRELQFIERGYAIGSSQIHLMRKHVLPNVLPLVFANTVLVVAAAILSETTLSFLGLGDPLNFSWGTMLRNAWTSGAATLPAWWYIGPAGLSVVAVVLGFTFVGRAFDAILDPKLRKRDARSLRQSGGESGVDLVADAGGPGGALVSEREVKEGGPL